MGISQGKICFGKRGFWCPFICPGHSRPLRANTEKLELPSISQVHTRGPVDDPWFNSHHSSQRPFSGDRLPNLNLQSYTPTSSSSYSPSASYGPNPSRVGLVDSGSGGHSHCPSSQTSSSSYSNPAVGIGLRTPSPSPPTQGIVPQSHGLAEEPTEYSHQSQNLSQYAPIVDSYSTNMNQPQYLDSHQPHMSATQSYASQPSTASHYPHYPSQSSVIQPGPGSYAPSPGNYGQYGFPNGVTSPQSGGQNVSSSLGQQMNPGLLPLPGNLRHLGTNISTAN